MAEKVIYRKNIIDKIEPFFHDDSIKVLTGVFGSGKSTILLQIAEALKKEKVHSNHIIYLDLKNTLVGGAKNHRWLHAFLKNSIKDGKLYYLMIDSANGLTDIKSSLLRIKNSFFVSIFVTDSNSRLLADRLEPSGREQIRFFDVPPFSFGEYLGLRDLKKRSLKAQTLLPEYLCSGGLPVLFGMSEAEKVDWIRHRLYEEVYKAHPSLDFAKFMKVFSVLAGRSGAPLENAKIANECRRVHIPIERSSIRNYLDYLLEVGALLALESEEGNDYHPVVYCPDPGMAKLYGGRDEGRLLATAVYAELRRQGFETRFEKTYRGLIDFFITKEGKSALVQVVGSFEALSPEEKEKIYYSFRPVKNVCPRVVLTLKGRTSSYQGICVINATDFFLDKCKIPVI